MISQHLQDLIAQGESKILEARAEHRRQVHKCKGAARQESGKGEKEMSTSEAKRTIGRTPSAHTPTPWHVSQTGTSVYFVDERLERGEIEDEQAHPAHDTTICECDMDTHPGIDPEANAAFIVRAVNSFDDLLAACEALLKFNEELCQDINVSIHYPSAEKARKALAKARGEQP